MVNRPWFETTNQNALMLLFIADRLHAGLDGRSSMASGPLRKMAQTN
ncbi:MAG: hypothetical protein P4L83_05290 [Nevskia sp.]|nr:hypothetical protein [Nevskia sp.]